MPKTAALNYCIQVKAMFQCECYTKPPIESKHYKVK